MNPSQIKINQWLSDMKDLKEDVMAGLYKQDNEAFKERLAKIDLKWQEAIELKKFEAEQDLAALTLER